MTAQREGYLGYEGGCGLAGGCFRSCPCSAILKPSASFAVFAHAIQSGLLAAILTARNTREVLSALLGIGPVQAGRFIARRWRMELDTFALEGSARTIETEAAINLRIDDAKRDAEAAVDPIQRINNLYDDMAGKAEAAAAGNERLSRSLTATLTDIERQRKAALDAQREADRTSRRTSERLPAVTMNEVADLIGAPITSGRRSRARNRAVGGSDNSYHLVGQAIDIPLTVNGKPLTKEGIRAALEPAGVVIKELLGPGDRGHSDHFHIAFDTRRAGADKMAKAAEKASRETQRLEQFGARAAERIQRLNERFDEQPRLIDQAAKSARELDTITKGLADRGLLNPEQAEQIAKAAAAIEDSLSRPFRDMVEDSERFRSVQELIFAGREDEARALEQIYALQDKVGFVTREQRETILDIVEQERELNELLAQRDEIVGAYVSSIRGVRSDLESLLGGGLSGGDFLKNLKQNFQRLQGRLVTEQLFGPFLRDLEEKVRKETGIQTSVVIMNEGVTDAGEAADHLATSLENVAERIDRLFASSIGSGTGVPGDPGASAGSTATLEAMFDQAFGHRVADNDNDASKIAQNTREAAKASRALERGVASMSPQAYAELLATGVTKPLADILENAFGLQLDHTLSGALQGHMLAGPFGAALGGLRGLAFDYGPDIWGKAFNDKLLGKFDTAFAGLQTGTQIAQLSDMLGLGLSGTGSKIGGTFGSLVGGPVGSIAGGIIGSTKKGRATIGGTGSDPYVNVTGNSGKLESAAGGAGDAVTQSIEQIAKALGADVNYSAGSVTISLREDNWRVDTIGTGITKTSKGALDFGQDQEAAVAAAVQDLINDGVLTGIRQSTLNILKAGKDLQKSIEDALAFENVFKELRRYKDPVGAAIDDLNAEFERLIAIFQQAGASTEEYAQLEELYGIKRAEAIEQATSRITASLQDLYDFLTYGDSGLSLRDRRSELVDRYNDLSARVEAGDTTAYDEFAQVARELLEVERQIYGSQAAYFDRHAEITQQTKSLLDQQQAVIDAASNADSPFDSTGAAAGTESVTQAISAMNDNVGLKVDATNQNLGTLINQNQQLIYQNQQLLASLGAQAQAAGYW